MTEKKNERYKNKSGKERTEVINKGSSSYPWFNGHNSINQKTYPSNKISS